LTDCWEIALQLAQQFCDKFEEPVKIVDGIESNSTAALEIVGQEVSSKFYCYFPLSLNADHVVLISVSSLSLVLHILQEWPTLPLCLIFK
jgi:hypothetical protein